MSRLLNATVCLTAPLWLGAMLAIVGLVFGFAIATNTVALSYRRFVSIARRHLRL